MAKGAGRSVLGSWGKWCIFDVLWNTPEKVDNLLRSNYLRVRFCSDFGQILVRFLAEIG